jgi:deoxyribonuclease V
VRRLEATIPYIPPFLSEKELPPTLEIYDAALNTLPEAELPQVIFIDGHGQWHERQAGLATSFGVERDIPTIGIGKNYVPLRPDLGMSKLV